MIDKIENTLKKFIFIAFTITIFLIENAKSQNIDKELFITQMDLITSDSSVCDYLYKYDYLNEKSLFIGFKKQLFDFDKFIFVNSIGAKIYVWPIVDIFFEDTPYWLEIDTFEFNNNKVKCFFHTKGILKFKDEDFIEGKFVLEKNSEEVWKITFNKVSTYNIIHR